MDDREKLMERYDDAAFALMMDEYAEAEGEAILAEFRAAAEAGELPEIPEELDKACRNTIRKEYARRERRVRLKQFRRAAARVAVAVFAVIGILSTLVMSVEALRVRVTDFFMRQTNRYTEISTQEDAFVEHETDPMKILCGLVPEGYTECDRLEDPDMSSIMFANENGDTIVLSIFTPGFSLSLDTEDAVTYELMLGDTGVMVIEKHGYSLVWNDGRGYVYIYRTSALSKEEAIEMCVALITELEGGAIAAGDS